MSKSQFRSWCRTKLDDLRLRKVVEDLEDEKDSWAHKSNQVDFKANESSCKALMQLHRLRYESRNSERYQASRNFEVRNGIHEDNEDEEKKPERYRSSNNINAVLKCSVEQAIKCSKKAIVFEKKRQRWFL